MRASFERALAAGVLSGCAALGAGCLDSGPTREQLSGLRLGGIDNRQHDGPLVAIGTSGPARFTRGLARALARGAQSGAPAARPIGRLPNELRAMGFGTLQGLELSVGGPSSSTPRDAAPVLATVVGASLPEQVVAVIAATGETGGTADASCGEAVLEGLAALLSSLQSGSVAWPARSLCVAWGDAQEVERLLLDEPSRQPFAAITCRASPRAPPHGSASVWLERDPDPGAVQPLGPDARGERAARAEGTGAPPAMVPSGMALVARTALVDAGILARAWRTSEIPASTARLPGLAERRIPMAHVHHATPGAGSGAREAGAAGDGEELRSTSIALFAAALAIADPSPVDLDRYLDSMSLERSLRLYYAQEARRPELVESWKAWFTGVRHWLRGLCQGRSPSPTSRLQPLERDRGPIRAVKRDWSEPGRHVTRQARADFGTQAPWAPPTPTPSSPAAACWPRPRARPCSRARPVLAVLAARARVGRTRCATGRH